MVIHKTSNFTVFLKLLIFNKLIFLFVIYNSLTTIVGHIELNGRLPGAIKFAGDGGSPKPLVILGELKSSISSLNIIPVDFERIIAPNLLNKDAFRRIKCIALCNVFSQGYIVDFSVRELETFYF